MRSTDYEARKLSSGLLRMRRALFQFSLRSTKFPLQTARQLHLTYGDQSENKVVLVTEDFALLVIVSGEFVAERLSSVYSAEAKS